MSETKLPQPVEAHPAISQWFDFANEGRVELKSGKIEIGQGINNAFIKLAADGSIVWQKRYGKSSLDQAFGIRLVSDGYAVGGSRYQMSGTDLWILKLGFDGALQWQFQAAPAERRRAPGPRGGGLG